MDKIYLDHAATSPVNPQVVDYMIPFMNDMFGNPSSIHSFGRDARKALDEAREIAAHSIHANPSEIIFTSGGTEADNLAILGVAMAYKKRGNHIITTQAEHHAVLRTCQNLEKEGFEVTYLPIDEKGQISIETLEKALTEKTILVSIMYGNNEVGTLQPIPEIGKILSSHQAFFHTDAVQAFGIEKMDVHKIGIDLLSTSSHKVNGPKGVGFLFAKKGIRLYSLLHGGEQETKRRAGTENLPAIIGFSKAIQISQLNRVEKQTQYKQFKETLLSIFEKSCIDFEVNGHPEESLDHIVNISFTGMNVESMLVNLDLMGIAVSSGSACTAGSVDPSHVLVAMYGNRSGRISSSIRFSFGLGNTQEQIERAGKEVVNIIERMKKSKGI
ncbi:cysteine desulfurase family protein [Bacillus carboniphilus]|uniref:cysteine desulfurase n=1 Tax=Bacillus carboniphilus TaxID=86663 RepID=A0ABY9K2B4_9BACI|nr:cysteine desulfurase family protein [Bacillus carboniphilus]WLR44041.1 cysteine desulfurase family protein [Bacillus carboniphilus]